MIDQVRIKEEIFRYVKDVLKKGTPSFSEIEIIEAIEVFYSTIIVKINYAELDGLSKILLNPLQDALVDKPIDLDSFTIIATSVEAYLKRVLVICGIDSFNNIKDQTLIPLIKLSQINNALTIQSKRTDFPSLEEANLTSFINEDEYLENICIAYLTRNSIHNSVDWSFKDTVNKLESILVLYIYITLKYKSTLLPEINIKNTALNYSVLNNQENKWLYDFMTFGKSTTEVKTQIIDAFILNTIYDNTTILKENLQSNITTYFNTNINTGFINRRLSKLQTDKRILHNSENDLLELTPKELKRLHNVRNNFKENRELFFLYYEDIVVKYEINGHKDELIDKLKDLFVDNYNFDLNEILWNDIDESNSQHASCIDFINKYLISIVHDKNIADNLFKDLLKLCIDSDFLLCISASTVFNTISDYTQYQNYVNQPIKEIYLDTQIVINSLMLDYRRTDLYNNSMYRITKELCTSTKNSQDIKLIFSTHYLSEITFQLKAALNLLAFGELLENHELNLSGNIFYQFYSGLKKTNVIHTDYYFADFIEECFSLYEDDLYTNDFFRICEEQVKQKIKELGYIELKQFLNISNLQDIETLIEQTIEEEKLPIKSHYILKNDAMMLSHLANDENRINEPFFLTWDKSFVSFRKKYYNKYLRRATHFFHIFSPSKFLNHYALMKVKLDPKMISEDFLSVIDSFGLTKKTRTIYDVHAKFIDIKNISKEQKYKYIKTLQTLFNENEFCYEFSEDSDLYTSKYDGVLDSLNQYYHNNSKFSILQFRLTLLQDEVFYNIAQKIKEIIIDNNLELDIQINNLVEHVNIQIAQFIEKQIAEKS